MKSPGIEMRDVAKDDFVAETVKVLSDASLCESQRAGAEGSEYLLLHYQKWPWTVLQVDTPKDMEEWRRHLNAANTQGGYIEYVKGRYDHIVFSRGADKHLEINQANAQDIADAIHEAIKDGARWWCLYGREINN